MQVVESINLWKREHQLIPIKLGRLKGREHPLYSSNALIYDAVQVLSKALNGLASMEVIQFGDVKYS